MDNNKDLTETFYTAFKNSKYQTMQDCYHHNIEFTDPLFNLKGLQAKAMWHMFLEQGADPNSRSYNIEKVTEDTVTVNWEARYVFRETGRVVNNKVRANLSFSDGKIIKHHDEFDLYKWTRMALGFKATLLGWTSFFQQKVKDRANNRLQNFLDEHPEYN